MSDTELELDARPVTVWELLGARNTQYKTPDFQRPFEWTEGQFEDLWSDLTTASENGGNHFLGQVILIEDGQSGITTHSIIDGQQRLTTLSIMLCAMRDAYEENYADSEAVAQIEGLLYTSDADGDEHRRVTLLNEKEDDDSYRAIYNGNVDAAEGNVKSAYDYFRQRLSKLTKERIDELRKSVLTKITLIRTECGDMTSAYQVFQTENDRGLELSPIDFAKSILFEAAARDTSVDERKVKEEWVDLKGRLDQIDAAGARRPIWHILAVNEYNAPMQMWREQFVRVFDSVVNEQLPEMGKTPLDFVKRLSDEADYYIRANSFTVSKYNRKNSKINSMMRHFRALNPHGGVVLYYLLKKIDSEERMVSALNLANILNVRINMSEVTAAKKRDPIYRVVSKSKKSGDILTSIKNIVEDSTPTDPALIENIKTRKFKKNDLTPYILLKLEREHFGGKATNGISTEGVQVEHIAPTKAFSKDRYTAWRPKLNHDSDRFDNYKKKIGNLTLLADSQNARAGTNPFKKKKREYRTSEFGMTNSLCDYNEWGFEQIEDRTDKLAELIVETWSVN